MDISKDHTLLLAPSALPHWSGYSIDAVQWLLAEPYRAMDDEATCNHLVADFSKGIAQIRMRMTGFNAESHVPDVVYACKYKPERNTFFMIRLDPATGQPWDVREEDAGQIVASFLAPPDVSTLMDRAFSHFSRWHSETFGIGPVAPSVDPEDPNSLAQMQAWTQARHEQIEQRTGVVSKTRRAAARI